MNRFVAVLWGLLLSIAPSVAWAEESHGYSRGNAVVYYAVIATILIYGIHDTFHNKALSWGAAVVVPISFYLMLPAK